MPIRGMKDISAEAQTPKRVRVEASITAAMNASVEVEATCPDEARWKALKHFQSGDVVWQYNCTHDDTLEVDGTPFYKIKRFLKPYELEEPYVGYTTWRRLSNGEEITSGFISAEGVLALQPGSMLKPVTAEERDYYMVHGRFEKGLPIALRKQVIVE